MANTISITDSAVPNPIPKPTIIRLENIFKIYGSGETEVKALNDVNLTIHEGEYCSIMFFWFWEIHSHEYYRLSRQTHRRTLLLR